MRTLELVLLKDLGTQTVYLSHGQTVQDLRVTGVLNERLPRPGDRCVLSTTLLAGVSLHRHVSLLCQTVCTDTVYSVTQAAQTRKSVLSYSLHRHSLLCYTVCTDT